MGTVATLVLLAAATLLLRAPFLAPRLAHWDAVNYALGMHEFNIAAHQPHPPGSPYFIVASRAALTLTGDDNSALLMVALAASVGAVIGEYALARALFGPTAGVLAAVLLMTHPVFWGYGTIGNAWTLLGCLAVGVGLTCFWLARCRSRLVLPAAVLLGISSGLRADIAAFLAPVWFWATCRATPDWRQRTVAIGLFVACVLAWVVPVSTGAGGLVSWSERLLVLLPRTDVASETLARRLGANTAIAFGTLAFTLGPLVILSLVASSRRAVCWLRATLASTTGKFLALWIAPAFTFLWLVDSTEPGHALVFIPALVALGAGLLVSAARVWWAAFAVAAQVAVFLFAQPIAGKPLAWTLNSMLLDVTAPGLHQQQASLDAALQTIHARFDPHETVVMTVVGQDAYRFMMYYLPEYSVLRMDPQAHAVLTARDKHQGNWTEVSGCLFSDGSARYAVWVLSGPSVASTIPDEATFESSPDASDPFQVWAAEVTPATPDYLGFRLYSAC